ncbi:MAG: MucB/RseB C-terminal domain-containing protein [Gammaproteobacteria bacterium]
MERLEEHWLDVSGLQWKSKKRVRHGVERTCWLILSFFFISATCAVAAPREALAASSHDTEVQVEIAEWLKKMDEALEQRSYTGRLVHQVGEEVRQVRLLHARVEGERFFRIQLLGGDASEIILRGNEFICLQPESEANGFRQVSLVQSDRFRKLAERLPELSRYYKFSLLSPKKICGRQAIGIAIQARDSYRLHHQLWLDVETALVLKGAVISQEHAVLEQFEFAEIDTDEQLTARDFDAEPPDARRLFSDARPSERSQPNMAILSRFEWLPPGFRPAEREVRKLRGAMPDMESVMFSDGMTSFTVFVERKRPANSPTSVAYEPIALPDVRQGATLTHSRLARLANEVGGLEPVVTTVMGEITFPAAKKVLQAFNGDRLH